MCFADFQELLLFNRSTEDGKLHHESAAADGIVLRCAYDVQETLC